MKKKLLVVALGLSSSIMLVGCGGGDGGGSTAAAPAPAPVPKLVTYNLTVIDGYLINALVWLDIDGDKQLDADEPSAYSEAGGLAKLDVTNINNPAQFSTLAKITVGETVDEDSGPVSSNYLMSAPPGEMEITPLSTLVDIALEQNTDGSETAQELAEIKQSMIAMVASDLGILEADVLGDYLANGSGSAAYAAENIVISKILPEDSTEFTTAIADNSDDATFNKKVFVVSDMIKDIVEITAEEDFATQVAVFASDADLDTDTDNDGLPDALDALPDDPAEWLDTDGDLIGNNADPDDDNDGVLDEVDIDPLDPDLGFSETKQVIQFLQNSGTFYRVSKQDNDNVDELYIDSFVANGDLAVMESYQRIRADGSLATLPLDSASDTYLTDSGWANIVGGYSINLADDMLVAYPTNHSDISYQVSSVWSDLNGVIIANHSIDWSLISDKDAVYPESAARAQVSFIPNQDTYSLSDHSPWLLRADNGASDGADATVLTDLITDTSAGDNPNSGDVYAVLLGDEIGVELLSNNTASFYTFDFSDTQTATKVAAATWSLETVNGEEMLSFTLPQAAIDSWGGDWESDSPNIIYSVYQGKVVAGTLDKMGVEIDDDTAEYVNEIAKNAFVAVTELEATVCDSGDVTSAATSGDFNQAVTDCGETSQAITSDMLIAQKFHRIDNQGDSLDHVFSNDGSVVVYEKGIESYTQSWSLDGDNVVLSNNFGENNEESNDTTWALLDSSESAWSMKFHDTKTYRDGEGQLVTTSEVLSSLVELRELGGEFDCHITYQGSGATIADFNAELADCGILPEMDLAGSSIMRILDSDQTRTYVFNVDNSADYYLNGTKYIRSWAINDDGNAEIYDSDDNLLFLMRLVEEAAGNLKFAVFVNRSGDNNDAIWSDKYQSVDTAADMLACEELDSDWDDVNDIPLNYRSYAEFKQAVTTCQDGKLFTDFSIDFIDDGITLTTSDALSPADDSDTYQFNEDGSGVYTYNDGVSDTIMPMTWTMHEDGVVKVVFDYTDGDGLPQTANDYLAIVETNGIKFSVKVFSRSTEYLGLGDVGGDLWGSVLAVPDE